MMDPAYLRASNGDGPAATAFLSDVREIGDMSVITDTVLNWPSKFVATVGELNDDGSVTEISVFLGHLEGSIVMIDEFAPGYFDEGYEEGQVIFIKPASVWADIVAGSVSGLMSSVETIQDTISDFDKKVFLASHPVGSTYWNGVDDRNPSGVYGGTWEAIPGAVLGGVSQAPTSPFNVPVGTNVGAHDTTLTVDQMPSHSHSGSTNSTGSHSHGAASGSFVTTGGSGQMNFDSGPYNRSHQSSTKSAGSHSHSLSINSTGGGQPHSNIQVTRVGYLWLRTA